MAFLADANLRDIERFYDALAVLKDRCGGFSRLEVCRRRDVTAARGVYFFFEDGESRCGSGVGPRLVRVGTHALRIGQQSTLPTRLLQHRGTPAGGNQRGSIFRRHVGGALMDAGRVDLVDGWNTGSKSTPAQRAVERAVEAMVSQVIGAMPFLWLKIDDEPSPESDRGYIERNSVALLSSEVARTLDPPSATWLGRYARSPTVQLAGLWNVQGVGKPIDAGFLDRLEQLVTSSP